MKTVLNSWIVCIKASLVRVLVVLLNSLSEGFFPVSVDESIFCHSPGNVYAFLWSFLSERFLPVIPEKCYQCMDSIDASNFCQSPGNAFDFL